MKLIFTKNRILLIRIEDNLSISEHKWEFERATLEDLRNGTGVVDSSEGLLIITAINTEGGMRRNGTVCKDHFNWYAANLFCRSIGFLFADWGSYPKNLEYAPQ